MEHTKKMVLVPETTYSGLLTQQNIQNEQVDPLIFQLVRLNDQLQQILNDPSLPADVKYQKYTRTLNRYLQLKNMQQKQSVQQRLAPYGSRPQRNTNINPYDMQMANQNLATTGTETVYDKRNTGLAPQQDIEEQDNYIPAFMGFEDELMQTPLSRMDALHTRTTRSEMMHTPSSRPGTENSSSGASRGDVTQGQRSLLAESEGSPTLHPGTSQQKQGLPEYSSFIYSNQPRDYKKKAYSLAEFVDQNPNIFRFDQDNQLIYKGKVVPFTDVRKLIKDFSKPWFKPEVENGAEIFGRMLIEAKAPKELVGSSYRYNTYVAQDNTSVPAPIPAQPQNKTPLQRPNTRSTKEQPNSTDKIRTSWWNKLTKS